MSSFSFVASDDDASLHFTAWQSLAPLSLFYLASTGKRCCEQASQPRVLSTPRSKPFVGWA
jgi:hypothetical protein